MAFDVHVANDDQEGVSGVHQGTYQYEDGESITITL